MERISRFEKVSKEQFEKDMETLGIKAYLHETSYDEIELPKRSTAYSAGYDFKTPISFCLNAHDSWVIPTGIRSVMEHDYFLMIVPRSGLGFKHGIRLANTVGIIDSDYCEAENEGHIFIKLVNDSDDDVSFGAGDKIAQGIFMPYGITEDDNTSEKRKGGIGSTGK